MQEVFLTLSSDPGHPSAGKQFTITVTLEQASTKPLAVTFEKHRVHVDTSGGHDLCVIQEGYFANNGIPGPVDLKAGETKGTTTVIVRSDAKNPPCPDQHPPSTPQPVTFPDHLMLTAFARNGDGKIVGQEQIVVTIKK